MISIKRIKVYDKTVLFALEYLLKLKLGFEEAVEIMTLRDAIEKKVSIVKTPYCVQVEQYGGKMLGTGTKPPYYSFDNPVDQKSFEDAFDIYLNKNEQFSDFNQIHCKISDTDYENLPENTETDLNGIVKIN